MQDGKQLELYAFSLKERPICNEMDEHAVVDLTQDENAQLRTEVEDLIQGLHKKLPTTSLGVVKFSCVRELHCKSGIDLILLASGSQSSCAKKDRLGGVQYCRRCDHRETKSALQASLQDKIPRN